MRDIIRSKRRVDQYSEISVAIAEEPQVHKSNLKDVWDATYKFKFDQDSETPHTASEPPFHGPETSPQRI